MCLPWGDLQRIPFFGYSFGVTTACALVVVLVSVMNRRLFRLILSRPVVLSYAVFISLGLISTILVQGIVSENISLGLVGMLYWLVALAVCALQVDDRSMHNIVCVYVLSTSVMLLISLADHWRLMDIPGINEHYRGFSVEGLRGDDLIGPFESRTVLATHLALIWPMSLYKVLSFRFRKDGTLALIVWSVSLITASTAVLFCTSRSLYIAVIVSGWYVWYRSKNVQRKTILTVYGVSVVVVLWILVQAFPERWQIVGLRFRSLHPDTVVQAGGHYRIDALVITINDLARNPLGMGFGIIEALGKNSHSIYTEWLRPGGVIGLVCVVIFLYVPMKVVAGREAGFVVQLVSGAMIGFLSYGISHSTQNMLMGWIMIGYLYYVGIHMRKKGSVKRGRTGISAGGFVRPELCTQPGRLAASGAEEDS